MTQPMNASLLRAKGLVPAFNGVTPDGTVASAYALIGIGEILQEILGELRKQDSQAPTLGQQFTGRRTRSRGRDDYGTEYV